MKKEIIAFSILVTVFSLTAYSLTNNENSATASCAVTNNGKPDFDFVYHIDSRFSNPVLKSTIEKATSIRTILPEAEVNTIASYHNIHISTFHEDRKNEVAAISSNEVLTNDQFELLQTLDHTSSFYITGNVIRNEGNGTVYDTLIYYMTVIPEQNAVYEKGQKVLINYLKKNSRSAIAIAQEKDTRPGKISFVVTKEGRLDNVRLTYSSGYTAIDQKLLQLMKDLPGEWTPATNAKGEPVDQELVFFFGQIGC